jgi:hypothetical protein
MNLRATYNSVEPQACGVQDKGSIIPAITQDGRAPQRDNTLLRQFCDCGNKVAIKRGNSMICQRCADIDGKAQPLVAGKRRFWGAPSQREYSVKLGGWK